MNIRTTERKDLDMGLDDKISNKAEELKGKGKEAAGTATGDEELRQEGKGDQASSAVKEGVEKVKDGIGDIKDKLTGK